MTYSMHTPPPPSPGPYVTGGLTSRLSYHTEGRAVEHLNLPCGCPRVGGTRRARALWWASGRLYALTARIDDTVSTLTARLSDAGDAAHRAAGRVDRGRATIDHRDRCLYRPRRVIHHGNRHNAPLDSDCERLCPICYPTLVA